MDLQRLTIDRGEDAPATKRRKRRSAGLGRFLAPVLIVAAVVWYWPSIKAALDQARLPRVAVVQVTRASSLAASAVSGTAANGYIVARHRAALSADTPGRIVEMNVEEGSVVKKGQVVARLYAKEYEAALRRADADFAAGERALDRVGAEQAASQARLAELVSRESAAAARLEEAKATLDLAQVTFERRAKLLDGRVVSQDAVDSAEAELRRSRAQRTAAEASLGEARSGVATGRSNVDVAEATVAETASRLDVLQATRDEARATLDKTEVRAPFDGIVVLKDAEVGEVVSPNSQGGSSRGSVATMVDFESLEVQVELPETSLAAVRIDDPANVYLDAFPDKLYAGRVQRIWPTANRQKATVEVRVGFETTDERLRPEMGVRVVFSPEENAASAESEASDALLVPDGCIVRVDGRSGVFELERDVARFRVVEVGGQSAGRTLVTTGLAGGERVVLDPPLSLSDGDRVRREE